MRIGFSGHRPNRLHVGVRSIRARLTDLLTLLSQEAQAKSAGNPLTAVSPLAEGSDRIFAEAALELGITLEALLPMSVGDYIQTFEDQSTTPAFHALRARSSIVTELPGSLADSKTAYEALGHAMVEECDVLVTVWDGKPAAGRGGTPEVIEYALSRCRRVLWVDAGSDRAAVQLTAINPRIETAPLAK